ncbi:MAG: hypothetical protein HYS12_07595 [Planctomycetes bacterium]|nr:hypothetical protein [Planctomycetota bacterium]
MPVSRLLVEGKLDIEVLVPLLAGTTGVDPRPTSKGSLAPRARDLRRDTGQTACYVRDRDFDFLPPIDLSQPTIDTTDAGATLGWRWCRHEIENYLIDPGIIHATFGWDRATFEGQLINAARSIKHYQAARWAVGQARQVLPPAKEFPSRPAECAGLDFQLPADLTQAGTATWVHTQAATFLASVQTALGPAALNTALTGHSARLTDAFLGDVTNVLIWCSGKDLLTGLLPWLQATHGLHPSQLRTRVRDWIAVHPDQTLVLLPEWDALRNLLRAYP